MTEDMDHGIQLAELRETVVLQRIAMLSAADRLAKISDEIRKEVDHITHDARLLVETA